MVIFRFLTYFMFLFPFFLSTEAVLAIEDTEATQLVESQEDDDQEDSDEEEEVLSQIGENVLTNASFHQTTPDGKTPKGWKKVVDGNVGNGVVDHNIMNIGQWELIFSKNQGDKLTVIKHALYRP